MTPMNHRFSELFAQLGLPDHPEEIRHFLWQHSPLDPALRLDEAPFWTPAQAQLLREELAANADWAQLVDQLNTALRTAHLPGDAEEAME
jgi:hypothetical protein